MEQYPKLEVMAYAYSFDHGTSPREIGMEDLTVPALRAMVRWKERAPRITSFPLRALMPALSAVSRQAAMEGALYIPDLLERFRGFVDEVQAIGGPAALREHLLSVEMCRKAVAEAAALLKDVSASAMGSPTEFSFFTEPLTGEIHATTFRRHSWGPSAISLLDQPGGARWVSGRGLPDRMPDEWADRSDPPFLFAARRSPWRVDPVRYAEFITAGGTDILSFLDGERSAARVDGAPVETWRLDEAAADLLDQGASGVSRQPFMDAVRDWNLRQAATMVVPDRTVVVPARPGVTKGHMEDWCRDHLRSTIDVYGDIGLAPEPQVPSSGPH